VKEIFDKLNNPRSKSVGKHLIFRLKIRSKFEIGNHLGMENGLFSFGIQPEFLSFSLDFCTGKSKFVWKMHKTLA
jgi:hypothetical protein